METHIVELVSNASMHVYPDNTMASFVNFLPEQITLDGTWEVALLEISYPALYHNVTDGRFRFKEGNDDKNLDVLEIPTGLYSSIDDILVTMKQVAAEQDPPKQLNMQWTVNTRNQKIEIKLPRPNSALNIISPDIAHILGFPMSFLLWGEGPHVSTFPVDILRVHSIMVYTDLIEYGIIGDTKAPILRCFPFISRIQNDSISTKQFMHYETFSTLQFKKLLKNSFHSIKIEIRDSTGQLVPFVAVGYTRLTLMFRKSL